MGLNLQEIFKDKTVLITGHTGFKGSWLSIWLHELGANVVGLSLDPYTAKDNFVLCELSKKIVDIRGDIRDEKVVQKVFDEYQPEFVFHLAAQPLVKDSYDRPSYTYDVNVMGTLKILDGFRNCTASKVAVVVTSDKCYENQEWLWGYRESDPMGGFDPYSSSKGCTEILVSSYRRSFFHPSSYQVHGKSLASVRAGNVIGGGDWSANRIIPDCIRALESNTPIILRNPQAVRPWQHVLEPLYGYLLVAANCSLSPTKYCEGWNFGPEPQGIINVQTVVEQVILQWGTGTFQKDTCAHPHEANLLMLNIDKARYKLHWKPKWNLEETVSKTIEWYREYPNKSPYEICLQQIKAYLDDQETF